MSVLQFKGLGLIAISFAVIILLTEFYWPMRRAEARLNRWLGIPEWSENAESILRKAGVLVGIIGICVGLLVLFDAFGFTHD